MSANLSKTQQMPIYRKPGTVVFIDDEPDFLEMIGLVMPCHWHVELFTSPKACLSYFQEAMQAWATDLHAHQAMVDEWTRGKALAPQVLRYWAEQGQRYGLPDVLVVDYAMPAMNGLSLLENLNEWAGACVLLSGQADEHTAVEAFNRGLLEQFILKQSPNIARRVQDAVERLREMPHGTRDQIWRSTLKPAQLAQLRDPEVTAALSAFSRKHWTEHVLLGDPFGMLGMSDDGTVSWLQLEIPSQLHELTELLGQESVPARIQAQLNDISQGVCLTDMEFQQALGQVEAASVQPAFRVGKLLDALFTLDRLPADVSAPCGHKAWRSAQRDRAIHD